jgi:uncharacterized protein
MRYEWDEAKRTSNLKEHGFDFADAEAVFAGLTATYEDDRFIYAEQRFVTLGLLRGLDCAYRILRFDPSHFFQSCDTP